MKALLSIQLVGKVEEAAFQSLYEKEISQQHPGLHTFSLDNFSDVSLISYAQELIKQAEQVMVLVESRHAQASLNKLLKLINQLVREKDLPMKLVLIGQHPITEKMARVLGEKFHAQPTTEELTRITRELFV